MKLVTAIRNSANYWLAAILAVACTVQETEQTQAPTPSEPVVSAPFLPGKAIVEFDDALLALIEEDLASGNVPTKAAGLNSLVSSLGISNLQRVFPDAGEYEARTRAMGLHRFYSVTFPEEIPVTKAVSQMQDLSGIVSVSPSRPIYLRAVVNDPYFSKQWHYYNTKTTGADINVKGVWENYTTGSENVIVCVVDQSVDPTHEDLQGNLWTDASGHTGYNYARGSYDLSIRPENGYGDDGHGTHVAGTIAAVSNNGLGVAGIAGGDAAKGIPGVKIMSHAIFSGTKSASETDTFRAIKEGADKGALISQNSWGYSPDGCLDGKPDGIVSDAEMAEYRTWTEDPAMAKAIEYFIKYAGCDAQGNQKPDSPMKGGLVIFAAGNDDVDYDVTGSNDPNVIMVGAFGYKGTKASYSNYGDWVDIAAPGGDGAASADVIWSTVPKAVSNVGYEGIDSYGYCWVGTSMACPHVSGVAALIVSYYGCLGFTAEKAKEILFAGLGNTIGGSKPIGKKLDALKSFQYGGFLDEDPLSLGIKQLTMHAHETKVLNLTVRASEGATITCTPGSDALVYDDASYTVTITGKNAPAGDYKASFVLKQSGKEDFTLNLDYTILPNHAPKVNLGSYKFDDVLINATGVTVFKNLPSQLSALFEDEDGEDLTISINNSNPAIVKVEEAGQKLNITTLSFGFASIEISATDGLGETASFSFVIAVKSPDKSNKSEAYPEVATDQIYIWPSEAEEDYYQITIYSVSGAKVMLLEAKGGLFNPIPVDISGLAPGVYTARISVSGKADETAKFVKY